MAYLELGVNSLENEAAVYPKAWKAIETALELDGNLAMAVSVRGLLKLWMNWDFAGAEQDLKRAIALAPGDLMIPLFYESFLCFSGRGDEAIASLKGRTKKRKPVGIEGRYIERQAFHCLLAGRYDEAQKELAKTPAVGPILPWLRGVATAMKGSVEEALAIVKDHAGGKDDPQFFWRKDHAWMLALAGRRAEAIQALDKHIALQAARGIDTSFDEACVYAGLGDKDKSFELLNRSYENHSSHIVLLVADWCLHSLHGDPRFEELAKKIGFPVIPRAKKAQDR